MFCTNCGQENSPDARFCFKCGGPIERPESTSPPPSSVMSEPDGAEPDPPPTSTPRPRPDSSDGNPGYSFGGPAVTGFGIPTWLKSAATTGWKPAIQAAITVGVVMFALGFLLAAIARAASGEDWTEASLVLPFYKLAGMLAFVLARMPLRVEGSFEFLVSMSGSMSFVYSLVLGFAIIAAALYFAGRHVGLRNNVIDVRGAFLEGIRIGIAFAAVALAGTLLFAVTGDSFTAGPDPSGALWRAFVYGALFGSLGAVRTVRSRLQAGWVGGIPEKHRLWGHSASGALTGVRYGLLFSLAAVIGAGVVAYLLNVPETQENLLGALIAAIVYLPNLVIVTLLLSHGATYLIAGQTLGLPPAGVRVNYFSVPDFDSLDLAYTAAPWWAFLLLIIPVAAVWLAGYSAAARARIASIEEANRLSVRVGLFYGLILWALASLESSTFQGEGFVDVESIAGSASIGISRLGAFFLPFLWGAAGTWLASRRYLEAAATATTFQRGSHEPQAVSRYERTEINQDRTEQMETAAVSCSKCGNQNSPEFRFCRSCGTPLSSAPAQDE